MPGLLSNIIGMIKPLDKGAMAEAQSRHNLLTKPQGSLGRLYRDLLGKVNQFLA